MQQRKVVLDTETTGLYPADGDRIIELGCVEIIDRKITGRTFQYYLDPEGRKINEEASLISGLYNKDLLGKPKFADIVVEFLQFIADSELIIHNANFDLGFLNAELARLNQSTSFIWPDNFLHYRGQRLEQVLPVLDTLKLARSLLSIRSKSLDALCRHYRIDNSSRTWHGALLDSELLAEVYLALTAGQLALDFNLAADVTQPEVAVQALKFEEPVPSQVKLQLASVDEVAAHQAYLNWLQTQIAL